MTQKKGGLAARRQRQQHVRARVSRREARQRERFIEPLTPRKARRYSKSLARLEFGPVERQIRSEIRGSAKREKDIGDWYGQLTQGYGDRRDAAQAAFQAAEDTTTQRLGEAGKRAQDTLKGLGSEDAQFAALVGGPRNSSGIAQMAEAAAAAERSRAALVAPLSTIRADALAAYAPRMNAAGLKGIEARQGERERRRKQQQDLVATVRERGMSAGKNYLGLREQDQTASTQRQALGVKAGYNKALNLQSRLGYKGRITQATIEAQATALLAAADRRGASAQEEVARLNREGKTRMAEALEKQARIQGKNSRKGGYSVKEAEGLAKTAGKAFKSPGAVVDYLVSRGVKYGVAKRAAHGAWAAAHR